MSTPLAILKQVPVGELDPELRTKETNVSGLGKWYREGRNTNILRLMSLLSSLSSLGRRQSP